MKMKMKKVCFFVLLVLFASGNAQANDLFNIKATIEGETYTSSYSVLEDILEVMDDKGLSNLAASYTTTSAASVILDIRGLTATAQYGGNSNTLVFSIPELNVYETFAGNSRNASQELFKNYIKKNGDGILSQILSYLVGKTAVDPVAGNPNSLMSQMGVADFNTGTDLGGGNFVQSSKTLSSENTLTMGLRFGTYSAEEYNQNIYSIPLKYTYRFDSDPRKQLIFDLPLVYSETESSKAYSGSFGIGFRFPITNDWSLTPGIRVGAVGSIDMGSAAVVYSAALTSNYNYYWKNFMFTLGNMFSYYTTQSIDIDDYEIDYDLQNTMTKNGIGVECPMKLKLIGKPTSWQCNVAYTYFWGDELYIDDYFDFGVSVGTRTTDTKWDYLRIGLTYTYCKEYHGIQLNFGYHF